MKSFFLVFVLSISAAAAVAQTTTGRLEGTVTDPQGAVIPGAEVKAIHAGTGQVFTMATDERGHWVIAALPTATYRVTISAPGFKAVSSDVKLDAGVPATSTSLCPWAQSPSRWR